MKRFLVIALLVIMSFETAYFANPNAFMSSKAYSDADFLWAGAKQSGDCFFSFNPDGTIKIIKNINRDLETLIIPSDIEGYKVTSTDLGAFSEYQNLKKLVLPDTLKIIGGWSFDTCPLLSDITIPDSVETILGGAFYGCESLEKVVLPESVNFVDKSVFYFCSNLKEITILNKDCEIDKDFITRPNKNITIYGYAYSTAAQYALNNNIKFIPLDLPETIDVKYKTHIQTYGWENEWRTNGELSGTQGEAKRLEAIQIALDNSPIAGDITYYTHVQSYGWLNPVKNGELSGTTGQAKRMEAIKIRLSGNIERYYDIYYRVHVQSYGWLGWAKNGEDAGTEGLSKRMEAIEIKIVLKNPFNEQDSSMPSHIQAPSVYYSARMQTYGWDIHSRDGQTAGLVGKAKRMEAFEIGLTINENLGKVFCRSHIEGIGWEQNWRQGITGAIFPEAQPKRMEAIQIKLSGEISEYYNIYYRVHVQTYGWLGWTKNGEPAGTEGLAKRLEAIEVKIVPKNQPAPGSTANSFIKK